MGQRGLGKSGVKCLINSCQIQTEGVCGLCVCVCGCSVVVLLFLFVPFFLFIFLFLFALYAKGLYRGRNRLAEVKLVKIPYIGFRVNAGFMTHFTGLQQMYALLAKVKNPCL